MVAQPQAAAVASPRVGVLALQGDYDAHALALEEAGAQAVAVRLPTELFELDALVIPGGESSALLKLMARDGLFDALRDFAAKKPVFGTCAGCILLARRVVAPKQPSLGVLDVTVERNAYGRQIESAILRTPTTLGGEPIETVYIRAPRIMATGPAVEVLAMRDGSPVLVRQNHVLASTFHPELTADRRVHRLFCTMAMEYGRIDRDLTRPIDVAG
ncbi:pyridoxal 5'-phosphate synthase glutaminase subunit PdxT [Dongia soli]|uniref:Pyridoxal 5'-phosphate synthase subunit PdxT n=1 Tax=Dongia soli TaxID=600628 RepID=A0ABU5EDP0_9PROT|nr:pyridoxal 5'-phosphate synthase glutaminase subunit PdxT [Dongia soli]MDY0884470.1 pyridoxal 5'-phosphate synthase glutaminase subunit PdxT [Dongia soli]